MAPINPVMFLVVPPPSTPTRTPTIVGVVLFGSIFILLIAGCFYYGNVCYRAVPSSNSGSRGDFFRNFPGLRSAFVRQPTAPNHPLSVRVDTILRTFNFRTPSMDLHSRNTRTHLAVPPPYGHPYEHPPSYEAIGALGEIDSQPYCFRSDVLGAPVRNAVAIPPQRC
ncbi:hypothetical protein V8D89_005471 [Ganoderma adspersum]